MYIDVTIPKSYIGLNCINSFQLDDNIDHFKRGTKLKFAILIHIEIPTKVPITRGKGDSYSFVMLSTSFIPNY